MDQETKGYKELVIWQRAIELVPKVYEITRKLPAEERFGLGDQLRRAAVSVPANIAEGQGRNHTKEFVQYLGIARGSLAELDTLLIVAHRLGYVNETQQKNLSDQIIDIRKPLHGLIQRLQGG